MRRPLAAVALVALIAAACSDSDDVTSGTTDTVPETTPVVTDGTGPDTAAQTPSTTESSSTPPPTTAGGDDVGELAWSTCDQQVDGIPTIECATLQVPLDYGDPDGAEIDIAVARLDTADDGDQIGSLVFNPGGPGGSGVEYLSQAALTIPSEVQDRFDLVGFDPRGVGASSAVECDFPIDDNITLLAAGDDAGWAELVADAEGLVSTCTPESQELFTFVGTNNAARDLDRLRAALGDEGLNYVGYSYGTRLGATYAELFPGNIRALVLDGAVKPTTDQTALNAEQALGFDAALEAFAAACDGDDDCLLRELGPTLDVIAGLQAEIAEVGSFPTDDEGRVLTPGELTLGIFAALYSQDAWPYLVQGLYVADVEQDGSILHALADSYAGRKVDGTYDNSTEANSAINCADEPARRTADEERLVAEAGAASSVYFPDFLRSFTGCLGIPAATDPLILGPAAGAPPILVVGTTGDPATPYQWAVELADFLDTGVLYTVEGEGHTAYGSIDCVADAVNAYLIDLELPAEGGASCTDDTAADIFLPAGESELDQLIALFACLRENGLDIPEIGLDDLLADPTGESINELLDPTDPAFGTAALACQDLL